MTSVVGAPISVYTSSVEQTMSCYQSPITNDYPIDPVTNFRSCYSHGFRSCMFCGNPDHVFRMCSHSAPGASATFYKHLLLANCTFANDHLPLPNLSYPSRLSPNLHSHLSPIHFQRSLPSTLLLPPPWLLITAPSIPELPIPPLVTLLRLPHHYPLSAPLLPNFIHLILNCPSFSFRSPKVTPLTSPPAPLPFLPCPLLSIMAFLISPLRLALLPTALPFAA